MDLGAVQDKVVETTNNAVCTSIKDLFRNTLNELIVKLVIQQIEQSLKTNRILQPLENTIQTSVTQMEAKLKNMETLLDRLMQTVANPPSPTPTQSHNQNALLGSLPQITHTKGGRRLHPRKTRKK